MRRNAGVKTGIVCLAALGAASPPALAETDKDARSLDAGPLPDECGEHAAAVAQRATSERVLHLAECLDEHGRTASAYKRYQDALNRLTFSGRPKVVKRVRERVAELKPKLSTITLQLKGEPAKKTYVTLNGQWVPGGRAHRAPVDPGKHVIEAQAPGHKTWIHEFTIDEDASERRIAIPPLEALQSAKDSSEQDKEPTSGDDDSVTVEKPKAKEVEDQNNDERRTEQELTQSTSGAAGPSGALVAGGIAALFAAGGLVSGIKANGYKEDFDRANANNWNQQGDAHALREKALGWQVVNAVSLTGAAVSAGFAAWLYWGQSNATETAARSGPNQASLRPLVDPLRGFVGLEYRGRL